MGSKGEYYNWSAELIAETLTNFNRVYNARKSNLKIGYAFQTFTPTTQKKNFAPASAWRDQVDDFLDLLAKEGLGPLFEAEWDVGQPTLVQNRKTERSRIGAFPGRSISLAAELSRKTA